MIENKPLVSFVMCCYNSEKYIRETINSVLEQNYKNFEFIIWNDGSSDNTEAIIKSYEDDRIKYYHHNNTGLGMALKLACEKANGKYIARIDADDICFANRLAIQVDFMERHPDCVLLSAAVNLIDEDGNYLTRTFPCTSDYVLKGSLIATNMILHPMVMLRTDAYMKSGGYLPVKFCEDKIFWSRMARLGTFSNITQVLGKYRLVGSSLSHSFNPYSRVLYELRCKMMKDESIIQSDIDLYNSFYLYSKKFVRNQKVVIKKEFMPALEMTLYRVLKPLLGEIRAGSLLSSVKNIFYRHSGICDKSFLNSINN